MKNFCFIVLIFLTGFYSANAQGGVQIFGGISSIHNTSPDITKAGHMQSGFTIGIQSRLKDGTFVAGPGLKYSRITMMSSDGADFFSKESNYHILSMPMNIGLEYRLNFITKLRMYTGGDLHYYYKIDDNSHEINYDFVNDYFFGAHAGIGIDLYWVTFDVIYEKGLTDAHKFENSKYNFLTATVGFFF